MSRQTNCEVKKKKRKLTITEDYNVPLSVIRILKGELYDTDLLDMVLWYQVGKKNLHDPHLD